jgi:hypothetical protein
MEEINYDTFDKDLEIYDIMVKDAEKILCHKFKIINQLPNSFLDFGCSEGIFVNAFNNITMGKGGFCGVEVALPKIKRGKERGLGEISIYFNATCNRACRFSYGVYLERLKINIMDKESILCIETPNNNNLGVIKSKNNIREDRFCRELYPPHLCMWIYC